MNNLIGRREVSSLLLLSDGEFIASTIIVKIPDEGKVLHTQVKRKRNSVSFGKAETGEMEVMCKLCQLKIEFRSSRARLSSKCHQSVANAVDGELRALSS